MEMDLESPSATSPAVAAAPADVLTLEADPMVLSEPPAPAPVPAPAPAQRRAQAPKGGERERRVAADNARLVARLERVAAARPRAAAAAAVDHAQNLANGAASAARRRCRDAAALERGNLSLYGRLQRARPAPDLDRRRQAADWQRSREAAARLRRGAPSAPASAPPRARWDARYSAPPAPPM
jgi:hypothetical protein